MKVLFCHDGPLRKDELNNYYGTSHNDNVFKRYFSIGDELTVLIRVTDIEQSTAVQQLSMITVKPFKVVAIPNTSSLKGMIMNRKKARNAIKKEVEESDFIVARLPSFIGFVAIDFAKKMKKPYLIELVTCPWDAYWNHSLQGKLIAPYMYDRTKRKNLYNAPYVAYVSESFLQTRYPTKGKTLNCSDVSIPSLEKDKLNKRLKKISLISSNQPIKLGTVAETNIRYKGQHYVIKAISILKKQGYKFEYHLVGGGNQDYLKKVAKKYDVLDNVIFHGKIPHDKLYNFYEEMDIYIQPSNAESHGRVVVEAMSVGCPVIGSSTGGIPELISKRCVFKRKNINDLVQKLKEMNTTILLEESKINFKKAHDFNKELLESKRSDFFKEFSRNSI